MHATNIIISFIYGTDVLVIYDEGDQEGLCDGVGVEEVDMEIGGRSDEEWSLLRSIWEPLQKDAIL